MRTDELANLAEQARKCAEIAKVKPSGADPAILFEMIAVLADDLAQLRHEASLG